MFFLNWKLYIFIYSIRVHAQIEHFTVENADFNNMLMLNQ